MSISKNLNGTTVIVPTVREVGWGNNVTGILVSICDLLSAAATALTLSVTKLIGVKGIAGSFQTLSVGGSGTTLNLSLNYNWDISLQASTTFTLTNPVNATRYLLYLKQDGTGGRTITWPASVKWRGGTPPVLSVAANTRDVVTLFYNSNEAIYLGEYGIGFA